MRKEQITPEVIELSKKIAEKWRMDIYPGCWYCYTNYSPEDFIRQYPADKIYPMGDFDRITPIPSIADCLQELKGKFRKLTICNDGKCEIEYLLSDGSYYCVENTPHEALLSALLEVL
jgi:hypothetical protein